MRKMAGRFQGGRTQGLRGCCRVGGIYEFLLQGRRRRLAGAEEAVVRPEGEA